MVRLQPDTNLNLQSVSCLARGVWYDDSLLDALQHRLAGPLPGGHYILDSTVIGYAINDKIPIDNLSSVRALPPGTTQIDALHNFGMNHWVHVRYAVQDKKTGWIIYHDSNHGVDVQQPQLKAELLQFGAHLSHAYPEWSDVEWQCDAAPCPMQSNGSDCGPFSLECLRRSSQGLAISHADRDNANALRDEGINWLYDSLSPSQEPLLDCTTCLSFLRQWQDVLQHSGSATNEQDCGMEETTIKTDGFEFYTVEPESELPERFVCALCGHNAESETAMVSHCFDMHRQLCSRADAATDAATLRLPVLHSMYGPFHAMPGVAYHCSECRYTTKAFSRLSKHVKVWHPRLRVNASRHCGIVHGKQKKVCGTHLHSDHDRWARHIQLRHPTMIAEYPDVVYCVTCNAPTFLGGLHRCGKTKSKIPVPMSGSKQFTNSVVRQTAKEMQRSEKCGYIDVLDRICIRQRSHEHCHTPHIWQTQCPHCQRVFFSGKSMQSLQGPSRIYIAHVVSHEHDSMPGAIKSHRIITEDFALDATIKEALATGKATVASLCKDIVAATNSKWPMSEQYESLQPHSFASDIRYQLKESSYLSIHWSYAEINDRLLKRSGIGRSLEPELSSFRERTRTRRAQDVHIRDPMAENVHYRLIIVCIRSSRANGHLHEQAVKLLEGYWSLFGSTRECPPHWSYDTAIPCSYPAWCVLELNEVLSCEKPFVQSSSNTRINRATQALSRVFSALQGERILMLTSGVDGITTNPDFYPRLVCMWPKVTFDITHSLLRSALPRPYACFDRHLAWVTLEASTLAGLVGREIGPTEAEEVDVVAEQLLLLQCGFNMYKGYCAAFVADIRTRRPTRMLGLACRDIYEAHSLRTGTESVGRPEVPTGATRSSTRSNLGWRRLMDRTCSACDDNDSSALQTWTRPDKHSIAQLSVVCNAHQLAMTQTAPDA